MTRCILKVILCPWIASSLKRCSIPLVLLAPLLVGCEDAEARRDREHVMVMQKQVTEASRELVVADANARKDWVDTQHSFEKTRSDIVRQQSDVQAGLDSLEAERRTMAAARVTDVLMSRTIEAIGTIAACLVPLLVLGWLMQRVWQNDQASELDLDKDELPANLFHVRQDAGGPEDADSLRILHGHQRYLPHENRRPCDPPKP